MNNFIENDKVSCANDEDLASLALQHGWNADPVSLYDEEGVEGWLWTSPSGAEFTCMGDWGAPAVDDDKLRKAILSFLVSKSS